MTSGWTLATPPAKATTPTNSNRLKIPPTTGSVLSLVVGLSGESSHLAPVRSGRRAHEAGNQVEKVAQHDGLRDIGVAAMVERLLFVARHREGGDRDHRYVAGRLVRLELARRVEPRHVGKLQIHQDEVGVILLGPFDRDGTLAGRQHVVAVGLEHIVQQLHVKLVVLDHEDPFGGGMRRGSAQHRSTILRVVKAGWPSRARWPPHGTVRKLTVYFEKRH